MFVFTIIGESGILARKGVNGVDKELQELFGSPVKEKGENFPSWCNTPESRAALKELRKLGYQDTVIFRAAVVYLAKTLRKQKAQS